MKITRFSKALILILSLVIGVTLGFIFLLYRQASTDHPRYPYFHDRDISSQTHTPLRRVTVIKRLPHRSNIFTQGLVWDNDQNVLYESGGRYKLSSLSMIAEDQQHILMIRPLAAEYFAEDITLLDNTLYLLTYRSKLGITFDKNTLELLGTFPLEAEGWGLTTDGKVLIMSDGSDRLLFKDPQTFQTIKELRVHDKQRTVQRINALQYVEGKIYANIWKTCFIAEISASSGEVLSWLDLRPLCQEIHRDDPHAAELNGIAWLPDPRHLLVTGKYWPVLFEIEVFAG